MSSFLSGGYTIDLDIIKSPSTSLRTWNSSSPSSTTSESSNSPLSISTRKPRTPRKRPNQTYNEAAALLSTAYPNIFSAKDICKPCKFIKPHQYSSFSFQDSSAELLIPFPVEKPAFQIDSTVYENPCSIDLDEICCQSNSSDACDGYEDFDAESMLDEEIEEGVIDSIMGNLRESTTVGFGLGLGLGLGLDGRFDFGFGLMRRGIAKAFRQNDEGDWWRFPAVDVAEISPRFKKPLQAHKNKKVGDSTSGNENSVSNSKSTTGVLLKLNYDEVLNVWSNRGSPFSDDILSSEFSGSDALVCSTSYY